MPRRLLAGDWFSHGQYCGLNLVGVQDRQIQREISASTPCSSLMFLVLSFFALLCLSLMLCLAALDWGGCMVGPISHYHPQPRLGPPEHPPHCPSLTYCPFSVPITAPAPNSNRACFPQFLLRRYCGQCHWG